MEEPSSKLKPKCGRLKGSKNKPKEPPNKEFNRITCSKSSAAFIAQITQDVQVFIAKLKANLLKLSNYKAAISSNLKDK